MFLQTTKWYFASFFVENIVNKMNSREKALNQH